MADRAELGGGAGCGNGDKLLSLIKTACPCNYDRDYFGQKYINGKISKFPFFDESYEFKPG